MKKRNVAIDILRVIATLFVVLLHLSGFFYSNLSTESTSYFLMQAINQITRISVPIFFLISGYLLLKEKEEIELSSSFRKAGRMFIIYVFWALISVLLYHFINHKPITLERIVIGNYSLWYLKVYIFLIIFIPFLNKILYRLEKKHLQILIFLFLVFSSNFSSVGLFLGVFDKISFIVGEFQIGIFSSFVLYLLLGYYIKRYPLKNANILFYISIVIIILMVATVISFSIKTGEKKLFSNFLDILTIYNSTVIFNYVLEKFKDKEKINNPIFNNIVENSFGIYLIHPVVLIFIFKVINKFIVYKSMRLLYFGPMFIIVFIALMIICMMISSVLMMNKRTRKVISV